MKIKLMAIIAMLAVLMLVMEADAAQLSFNPHHTLAVLVANQGSPIGTSIEGGYRLEQQTLINLRHTNITDITVWGFNGKPSKLPRIDLRVTDRVMKGRYIAARNYQLVADLKGEPLAGSIHRVYVNLESDTITSLPIREVDPHSREFFEKWRTTIARFVYVPLTTIYSDR